MKRAGTTPSAASTGFRSTCIAGAAAPWEGSAGLFVPTSEGIIVIDGPGNPCTPDSGQWFRDELEQRYDVPVRYVVLSHDHQSHICGTTVFADTAVAIGSKKLRPHLIREGRVAPVPTVSFDGSLDIDLGGVKVVLHYLGPTHSDNLIVTHTYPRTACCSCRTCRGRTANCPTPISGTWTWTTPSRCWAYCPGMDDVDIVMPGHNSPVADQSYFRRYRDYLATLRERVLDHMVAGRTLEEILGLVTMSELCGLHQPRTGDRAERHHDVRLPVPLPGTQLTGWTADQGDGVAETEFLRRGARSGEGETPRELAAVGVWRHAYGRLILHLGTRSL